MLNSENWRQTLSHWLETSVAPVACDVQMISSYFEEYAQAKRLNELILFLKYMHRYVVDHLKI